MKTNYQVSAVLVGNVKELVNEKPIQYSKIVYPKPKSDLSNIDIDLEQLSLAFEEKCSIKS